MGLGEDRDRELADLLERNSTWQEGVEEEARQEVATEKENEFEEEEGEIMEERTLVKTKSKLKKPNTKPKGKRGPKSNKKKLEIVANAKGQKKLRSRKEIILLEERRDDNMEC